MIADRNTKLRPLILAVDGMMVLASMGAAYGGHALLREHISALREPAGLSAYAAVAYLALPLWIFIVALTGADRLVERRWTRLELFLAMVRVHILGLVGLVVAVFVTQSIINRSLLAVFLIASFCLMFSERLLVLAWLHRHRTSGHGERRLIVVGDAGPVLTRFVERASSSALPPKFVGRIGEGAGAAESDDGRVAFLGEPGKLATVLSEEAVDEVVFLPPYANPDTMSEALDACETVGVPASFALDLAKATGTPSEVTTLFGQRFLTFEAAKRAENDLAIKHTLDVLLAAIGLLLVAPLLLVVALLVLVTMGRPVFFLQRRAGLRGREFSMVKFRTMVRDAEAKRAELEEKNEMSGPVFKITDDPRVTRLGRFLRKSSIDELPQLFNVLSGTMSLVGPRPLPVAEQRAIVGWHRRRLSMKPGITCIWQISGRSDVDFDGWMAYDLTYVDTWSLSLDLSILLQTIPVVLKGRGAK